MCAVQRSHSQEEELYLQFKVANGVPAFHVGTFVEAEEEVCPIS